ncbi:MAG: hypothetical protein R3D58_07120 [Saprospiraceae bacterium]|nr:hypothetical protein [Lewinellaceae bacterium]
MCGAVCGVSRGRYIAPVPVNQAKLDWTDEDGNQIKIPKKYPCEHDSHWKWGKGTRNGQKLYYPTEEMFWQKWFLTEQEFYDAVDEYDVFSLEMTGRIICRDCTERERMRHDGRDA